MEFGEFNSDKFCLCGFDFGIESYATIMIVVPFICQKSVYGARVLQTSGAQRRIEVTSLVSKRLVDVDDSFPATETRSATQLPSRTVHILSHIEPVRPRLVWSR
ncbi:hypothetical protein FRB95_009839 [Tulasnella sp. JGI-2019a]|nr:hypothetical protein FRB95_009839 [Tulasnella sp. JGI-2019a]